MPGNGHPYRDRAVVLVVAFLVGVLVTPICLAAEPPTDVKRIGILYQDPGFTWQIDVFRETLRRAGYIEGKTIAFEPRLVAPGAEDLQRVAAELVGSGVDVIVAAGTPTALAVRRVSSTIPIVFVVSDPVASGLVTSLGRPGGTPLESRRWRERPGPSVWSCSRRRCRTPLGSEYW